MGATVMTDLSKLFRGEHPFITQPATWMVAGHGMSGEPLKRIPIQGRVQITHQDGKVFNYGEMSVVSRSTEAKSFTSSYEMTPTEDELVLTFHQLNESVGDLSGRVVAFDDRLVSSYTSGDGSLMGCEVLYKMGENHYTVTGTLVSKGKLVNLWKLDLVRPSTDNSDPGKDGGS
jgi:hypothetical protein